MIILRSVVLALATLRSKNWDWWEKQYEEKIFCHKMIKFNLVTSYSYSDKHFRKISLLHFSSYKLWIKIPSDHEEINCGKCIQWNITQG